MDHQHSSPLWFMSIERSDHLDPLRWAKAAADDVIILQSFFRKILADNAAIYYQR
jgi:hypothetical protein